MSPARGDGIARSPRSIYHVKGLETRKPYLLRHVLLRIEGAPMTTACLLLMSSVVGQMSYYPKSGYSPGYTSGYFPGYATGYYNNQTPLQYCAPTRYARYYEGSGFYPYPPPPIADSEIINLR